MPAWSLNKSPTVAALKQLIYIQHLTSPTLNNILYNVCMILVLNHIQQVVIKGCRMYPIYVPGANDSSMLANGV